MSATPHIAILGSGPTGIEAALAAIDAGFSFTLFEAGPRVAESMRSWGHVRLFSPWDLDVSPRMRRHLEAADHRVPVGEECPTGRELVAAVLAPLCDLPALAPHVRLGQKVVSIGREGLLKHEAIGSAERGERRFRLLLRAIDGAESSVWADRVLDCTGTYSHPNALGDGGIPAIGETSLEAEIERHIPDVAAASEHWAGRTTLLVGAGHSAQTVVRDLAALAEEYPATRVLWALRGEAGLEPVKDDPLPERTMLISAAAELAAGASPAVELLTGVSVQSLVKEGEKIRVILGRGKGEENISLAVDRVLSMTGFVGDHTLYRQLQVHECYATSGPMQLAAALLGESSTDCLAQSSHGADSLKNPEPGFFILGAKSYGRNTSFLMRTGWQQVADAFALLQPLG